MKLLSINVSQPKTIAVEENKAVTTGIFKVPVVGPVLLRRLNLDGDGQADLSVHGGPDKAVYVYTFEHYDFWKRELGHDGFPFGQFGENFTVTEMAEDKIHIGDRFRVGDAEVEVTQPRIPCFKLALRMAMPDFPKRFLASGRCGFYLRVTQEGRVSAGDVIERVHIDPELVTVREILGLRFLKPADADSIQRVLRVHGLSQGWRETFQEKLKTGGTAA